MILGIPETETYYFSRWLFLRFLGVIYLIAFLSLGVQITGLVGQDGILPAKELLGMVQAIAGSSSFWKLPTIFWLNASDFFLQFVCFGGAVVSICLILGFVPALAAFLLWFLYLSLFNVGQEFLSFQWDILLLETGFLAVFFTPLVWKGVDRSSPPSRIVLMLFWWLLFRLMFSSGFVKLASGDETWRFLTALNYHYETQPIPSPISWYAHQIPDVLQSFSVLAMFFIELVTPFFIFASAKCRRACAALLALLQLLIIITGNYGFFNLLAIALCLLILDDASWPAFVRRKIIPDERVVNAPTRRKWARWITIPLAVVILLLSLVQTGGRLTGRRVPASKAVISLRNFLAPFYITGTYGLFAVMTTSRPEIIVEGSNDGENWMEYEFKYKAGAVDRSPPFVAPHMPRLDWQMWFAALSNYQRTPWFGRFLEKLLEGSPQVLGLLSRNPFPGLPPKFVRAVLYDYRFTDFSARKKEGHWWKRKYIRLYYPVVAMRDGS
ncbi:MAG: lipase maturation factor family protein [Candidatus Omnitrophica bacterium]|nr:lipase maturation factor family protein [Candidatus Omnitrophota bacterium]